MKSKITAVALAMSLGVIGAASAGTSNGNLNASVNIVDDCLATVSDLSFGNIGLMRVNKDAQTNVSIQCTKALPYTVKFFDAADAAATTFAMKDAGAVNDIAFSLYQDSSRTIAWDSVNGKTGTGNAGATATNVVLYGRIPPQAAAPEGHYVAQMRAQIDF